MLTTLPLALQTAIVQHVPRSDLPALARTSSTLQPLAEAQLYDEVILREPNQASHACAALSQRNFARAPYVRRFWLYQDGRLCRRAPWPPAFARTLRGVLAHMPALEYLYLDDAARAHSALLAPPLPFRLREALLGLRWDAPLVAFLETQDRLRFLSLLHAGADDGAPHPPPPRAGSLPALTTLEAPLHAALALLPCAPQRLAIVIDDGSAPLFTAFLDALARSTAPLSSLNVVAVPEFLVGDTLAALGASRHAASLRHLGVLALPLTSRHTLHASLLHFSRLEALQVDVSHWAGTPLPPALQRMLGTELRTFCPTLRQLVVWHGNAQTLWRCDREPWVSHQPLGPRYPARDGLWREF